MITLADGVGFQFGPQVQEGPQPDWSDERILAYVDALPDLANFDAFVARDLRHYNKTQLAWISTAAFFTGIHLGRKPTETEVCEELIQHHTPQRFKAFYFYRYPDKVERS